MCDPHNVLTRPVVSEAYLIDKTPHVWWPPAAAKIHIRHAVEMVFNVVTGSTPSTDMASPTKPENHRSVTAPTPSTRL